MDMICPKCCYRMINSKDGWWCPACNHEKKIFRATPEELMEARQRLASRQNRGSDEEYAKNLLEEHSELEPLRKRANGAMLD